MTASRQKKHPLAPPQPGWAIYLRTSSEDHQKPELSRERQRTMIQISLRDLSDLPVYKEYIDVLSGKNSHRKAYQQMLADARVGKFSHVIVERADRFGRNDTEALRAIDELHEFGVAVRFANSPDLDPMDPDDRVLVTLTFALARRESALMGIRVKGGLKAKRESGGYAGRAPDGYLNIRGQTDLDKRSDMGRISHWIEPDPNRAHIWQEAWALLLTERMSLDAIAETLHAKGYCDRNGKPFVARLKTGRQRPITAKLLRAFHDWTYAGWVVSERHGIAPKTIRGNWEPIVSTEDFEAGLMIVKWLQHGRLNEQIS